ncbi:MAG TPA: protein-L-isoaspartate O-methyltransferase [Beijerinckiaceae bacterium]|nr:protein-L-isoaspartate O-methyltransferase [Beijerinckiaceae bacterium]
MTDFSAARRTMVENQIRTYDVSDKLVLAAFEAVPRECFVRPKDAAVAYLDREQMAADGITRLLPPLVLARLMQALELASGQRALDCGSAGYGAALLAAAGLSVVSCEAESEAAAAALARAGISGVEVVDARPGEGAPAKGPFDVILVHGAAEVEPASLLAQLKDGGRLGIIMGLGRAGRASIFRRVGKGFGKARAFDAAGPALQDFARKPEFSF